MSDCPKLCHDKRACLQKCGKKKCGCIRNTECDDESSSENWGPRRFPCDLPCDNKGVIDALKIHVYTDYPQCHPWVTKVTTIDPLRAFHKCAKPVCLHHLPPCDVQCPLKKCPKECTSSESSSSSTCCERVVIPKRPICEDCSEESSKCKCSCSHSSHSE